MEKTNLFWSLAVANTIKNLPTDEFAKLRVMRAARASVVYLPTCPRANVPKACQLLILTCQTCHKRTNLPKPCQFFNFACQRAQACQFFKLACQRGKWRAIFSPSPSKRCANFSTIFQKNYIFLYAKHIFYIFCIFLILHLIYF